MAKRDFLTVTDFSSQEIQDSLILAQDLKAEHKKGALRQVLKGKVLALIFHKPSLRTRVSFESGMYRLGGSVLYMTDKEIGMGSREAISDVGNVISRYVDGVMIRTFAHKWVEDLAANSQIPIINGLTDDYHPCQIMADLLTVQENFNTVENKHVVFIGDGNNVAKSWMNAARRLPFQLTLTCPEGYEPDAGFMAEVKKDAGDRVRIINDPMEAAKGADVLYTDVWASMGQESETAARKKIFQPYQLNSTLLGQANKDCLVLHCLPAHRGEEITDDVIDGPNSRVFDQAENRMHAQNALLVSLMGSGS